MRDGASAWRALRSGRRQFRLVARAAVVRAVPGSSKECASASPSSRSQRPPCCAPAARAEDAALARVASPDGRTTVELSLNGEGRLAWRAARRQAADRRFAARLRPAQRPRTAAQPRAGIAIHAHQRFDLGTALGRGTPHPRPLQRSCARASPKPIATTAASTWCSRVYDDGLGFRYELPRQPALQRVEIEDRRPNSTSRGRRPRGGSPPANGTATNTCTARRRWPRCRRRTRR